MIVVCVVVSVSLSSCRSRKFEALPRTSSGSCGTKCGLSDLQTRGTQQWFEGRESAQQASRSGAGPRRVLNLLVLDVAVTL